MKRKTHLPHLTGDKSEEGGYRYLDDERAGMQAGSPTCEPSLVGHEKARIVAERVVRRIGELVPPGLGHWGPSWGLVAVPSDVFFDRLKDWEEEDTSATRSQLEAASADLIEAWAEAGRQWEAAGRPSLDEKAVVLSDAPPITA